MEAKIIEDCKSFRRPSEKAEEVRAFKLEEIIEVYPLTDQWMELRPVTKEGTLYTEFIQKSKLKLQ
ncbi:MAG: hypothetical protein ACLSYB_08790 [Enterococcus casseliflavus]